MQKNILITGISSGIGAGLLNYYLNAGCHVYGVSRRKPTINSEHFHFTTLDLSKLDQIPETLVTLLEEVTSLELVVLNAGIMPPFGDMKNTSLADIKDVMQINVWANKVLLDCLISHVPNIKQVIGITSRASQTGSRGLNGYAISKVALNTLITLYAAEEPNIHFTALMPGLIDTPITEYICQLEPLPIYPSIQKVQSKKGTPDMLQPEEVAPKLAWAFERVLSLPSGQFVDIHNLG